MPNGGIVTQSNRTNDGGALSYISVDAIHELGAMDWEHFERLRHCG